MKGRFALSTHRKAPPSAHNAPKLIPLALFFESESVTNTNPEILERKKKTLVKTLESFEVMTRDPFLESPETFRAHLG